MPVRSLDVNIKTKLVLIILVTSLVALLLAGTGFVVHERMRLKEDMAKDLQSLARIVSGRSTVALSFGDPGVAEANLSALGVKPAVVSACIYNAEGGLFAEYRRGESCPASWPARQQVGLAVFGEQFCRMAEDIELDGQHVGRVLIVASLAELNNLWRGSLIAASLIVVLAGAIAFLMASRLQRVISAPLVKLKKTVETINRSQDYTLRAERHSNDELGALISAFNTMIATIENRDRQLAESRHQLAAVNEDLERRVAARTAELAETNVKLAHNGAILTTVLDSMSQGLIAFDANLKLLVWNKQLALVRGYPEELLQTGRDHSDFERFDLHDDALRYAETKAELREALERISRFQPHRYVWTRADGKVLEISGGPISDGGFVSTYEDVTLRKQYETALKEARDAAESATQTKSQFLANMSHEIRTPMNGVLGMLHLALQTELSASQRNYLAKAYSSARALLGILNDILDFSKIEAGKLTLEQAEFRFDAVVDQLADVIGYQAGLKNIEFLIRHDPEIPPLLIGDPLRLGQVLTNLCSNALKFTERGELELAFHGRVVAPTEMELLVTVRDTGIGMSRTDRDKLFTEFTQADQGTSRRFGGTGLGLAISKKLVEMMRGRIWIDWSEPGLGTTFCFTARLGIVGDGALRPQSLEDKVGRLLADVRVLVVDDNEASREIIADMLRPFGVRIGVAASGAEALTELRQATATQSYELVLVDWHMPGMNGDEVVEQMRADPRLAGLKAIMVTAYGNEDVMRLADKVGIDGFLIKPVSPSSLLDAILSALGRGRIQGMADKFKPRLTGGVETGPLHGRRILLVEDNEINREFAGELLRGHGLEVDEAVNGEEAVRKVCQTAYDAVLMDIQMPVLDGLEAVRQIRSLTQADGADRFGAMPIIAMTAHAMAQDVEKSLQAGMNDHITKPIDPERLLASLTTWIAGTGSQTPPASATASVAYPADLQCLRHIDVAQGIRRIGGNSEAYRRQLLRFLAHYADSVTELRASIEAGRFEEAEAHCHALKGVSGNLGAQALFEAASSVDAVLKQSHPPAEAQLADLEQCLARIILELTDLAAKQPENVVEPKPVVNTQEVAKAAERLARILDTDLGAVESALAELRALAAGGGWQAELDAIAKSIDRFAIDEAQLQLARLRDGLQPENP
ncbi:MULTISPECIES: response regulator [unclassified Methylomonas]|uniref:response regulator n=1 Tax=unclassified Methylomonas TaxID=2608980 RepID=UPI000AA53A9B|nr:MULTISPECIES: response regulator [unclassified Methylomonas]WGS88327.1 response regulator [Methylomonas sp. UP202]